MLRQNTIETASAKEAAHERDNEVKKVTLTHTLTLTLTRYPILNPDPDPYIREIGERLAYDTS